MSSTIERIEKLIALGERLGAKNAAKVKDAKLILELFDVCTLLYLENVDYIKLNNLGDPHHNNSMQRARDIIGDIEKES